MMTGLREYQPCEECSRQLSRLVAHVHVGGRLLVDSDGAVHRVLGCKTMPASGKTVAWLLDEHGEEYVAAPCALRSFTFPGVA